MTDARIVLTACADEAEADRLADHLVQQQLAACVSILPGMRSIFRWKGQIERAQECLLLIKTVERRLDALKQCLMEHHSYETPEFLAINVADGLAPYLFWLNEETRNST